MDLQDKFRACMIGAALGDAFGYPVKTMDKKEIIDNYGENGVERMAVYQPLNKAMISDNTQLMLFTADGMVWADRMIKAFKKGSYSMNGVYQSYQRWLYTQTGTINDGYLLEENTFGNNRFILDVEELHSRREPSEAFIEALSDTRAGSLDRRLNDNKDSSSLVKVIPVGLMLHEEPEKSFEIGCEVSALTHGNPTGYLSAGVLSYIVSEVLNGKELEDIIKDSIEMIKEYEGHEELHDKLSLVLDLNADDKDIAEAVDILEEGVDAHGVLSTALYALLSDADSKDTLKIAANHSGESSAVAAICGGIIGLDSGLDEFPEEWVENLELSDFIVEMSDKLYNAK